MITIFTDGSSRGNPGKGGWGALIVIGDSEFRINDGSTKVVEIGGREDNTTNNRMELTAIKEALTYVETRKIPSDIKLHTDSTYAMNGLIGWMYSWEKNGWKTKTNDEVLNQDIWKELLGLMFRLKQTRTVDIVKVEGHAGVVANERVDEIATKYADGEQVLLFVGGLDAYIRLVGADIFSLVATQIKVKSKSSSAKAYSYVSLVNGKIHLDKTWADCEKRVKGRKGVKYKKSISADDEKKIISEFEE
jgi:ribonuclease HI